MGGRQRSQIALSVVLVGKPEGESCEGQNAASGNLLYKVFGKVNTGPWKGQNFKALERLSEAASVLEMVVNAFQGDFNSAKYPDKIEHNFAFNGGYRIFYRAKKQ